MPHVIPADAEKFSICNQKLRYKEHTERDDVICYQFLSRKFHMADERKTAPEKPRTIIVGLQIAKDGDQTKN